MTIARTALLLLVGACDPAPATPAASAEVAVGVSTLRISLPVLVAVDRGLFADEGLAVELRRYETAQPLVDEVLDGRIDAGGYAALPIVAAALARGGDAPSLATMLVEDEAHPISRLVRRAGDVTLESPADLAGRRVGILPTIAYRRWIDAVLAHAGVDASRVTIVPVAPPQQVRMLAEGGVDALFTGDPMATGAIAAGAGEAFGPVAPVPDALGGEVDFGAFLVGARLVRERPDVARRLVASLDGAIELLRDDPAVAREAMASLLRPEEQALAARYPTARYLGSGEVTSARIDADVRALVAAGVIAAPVPLRALPGAGRWPPRSRSPACTSRSTACPCSVASTCASSRASASRSSGATARASRRCSTSCSACVRRRAGP
jgi:NitT/TauT family transport system substrate-binding protein